MRKVKAWVATAAAATLVACGGGEILAIVQFVGSVGGDWVIDDAAQSGFQQRVDCGTGKNEGCFVNIQPLGTQNLFSTDLNVRYTGNLPGCPPAVERTDGMISGNRINLPGCFSGRYITINESLSDDGKDRAYFDSAVPDLREGVWVEIQRGERRFKFDSNSTGCELTVPARKAVNVTIDAANLGIPLLQTTITRFDIAGEVWAGGFVGMSGMRLQRGTEVMELERRRSTETC